MSKNHFESLIKEKNITEIDFSQKIGIYFLCHYNKIIYIGQSIDIDGRLRSHLKDKKFNKVFFIPCLKKELENLEIFYIEKYKPILNIANNPDRDTKKKRQIKYFLAFCPKETTPKNRQEYIRAFFHCEWDFEKQTIIRSITDD